MKEHVFQLGLLVVMLGQQQESRPVIKDVVTGWIDFYKKDDIKFAETEAQDLGLWNSDMGITYKSLKRK